MQTPLVSVVVSAYNRPGLLRQGLASVVDQTYRNLEILVQDDSTNDECKQVVAEFPDARISYRHNTPSLGTLANLRQGYRRSSGTYVSTLNDDDMYSPRYLEQMVAALEEHPGCSLAFADHSLIDENGNVDVAESDRNSRRFGRDKLSAGVQPDPLQVALIAKSVPGMFAVYRRARMDDFTDFPDEVSSGYDLWLIYLSLRCGGGAFYCPERLTSYRVHSLSQTSSFADPKRRLRSLAYDLYMNERFFADPRLASIHPALISRLEHIHTAYGSTWIRVGDRRNALAEFAKAIRLKPQRNAIAGAVLAMMPSSVAIGLMDRRSRAAGK